MHRGSTAFYTFATLLPDNYLSPNNATDVFNMAWEPGSGANF